MKGFMAEPEGKQLTIQFWAPDDVPVELQNLVPPIDNDGWVAYVPAGLMEKDLVKRLLSSVEIVMIPLPYGGALFAGPAEAQTLGDVPEAEPNSKM